MKLAWAKTFVILGVSLGFGSTVRAAEQPPVESEYGRLTEIQIFINYRGPDDYDQKVVSTWQNPATAEYLYVDSQEEPLNGACFKGNPEDALDLFREMVAVFNHDNRRALQTWGESYYDPAIRSRALTIYARDERGVVTTWFPRMRECVRWSTPAERQNF